MYMLIGMGLFHSSSVLHVTSLRCRRCNAVVHSKTRFVKSTKLASLFTHVGLVQKQVVFDVTFYLFRLFIGLIIPLARASLFSFLSLPSFVFYFFLPYLHATFWTLKIFQDSFAEEKVVFSIIM